MHSPLLGLVFLAVALQAETAWAENRYAVLHVNNTTADTTVSYKVRWGASSAWGQEVKLQPGQVWNHWYQYPVVDQNHSPIPQITFKSGINRTRTVQLYDLLAYASPAKDSGGHRYAFEKRQDAQGEDYIELIVEPAKTEPVAFANSPAGKQGLKSMEAKKYQAAVDLFTKAIADAPAEAYFHRARAYRALMQYPKCIDDCGQVIALDGHNALAYNLRGLAHEESMQLDLAIKDYEESIRLRADLSIVYYNLANVYLRKESYSEAEYNYKKALQRNLAKFYVPLAHNMLGITHLKQGQYDLAINSFNQAIAQKSGFAAALSNRGGAYYKRGDYALAIKDLDQAVQLTPRLAAPYRWRSQAYGKLGRLAPAKADYYKAIELDPEEEERFDSTAYLVDRPEALRELARFRLGSTLTSEKLLAINSLQGGESSDGGTSMAGSPKQLIASETAHLRGVEFEMVAAADLFLRAAKMSPEQRLASGYKLAWLFGPVSAPNNRWVSKDGLAGLRIIGRLELPGGQEINSIAAVRYFPPPVDSDEDGSVGFLSNADNFLLEVKLFKQGATKNDYAFQSFSVSGAADKMTMRPGFYLDRNTGAFAHKDLIFTALGTSCINCHGVGPKYKSQQLKIMWQRDYAGMEGLGDFLEQMKHWSASVTARENMAEVMKTRGPVAFLPLDAMLKANQEHWISIYHRYQKRAGKIADVTTTSTE